MVSQITTVIYTLQKLKSFNFILYFIFFLVDNNNKIKLNQNPKIKAIHKFL